MATNNQKFNNFLLVINAPKEKANNHEAIDFFKCVLTAIQNYNKLKFFASIIHDRDILESGELKTIHQHIVVELNEKMTVLAVLRDFSNLLDIDKSLISVEGSNNEFLSIQYLTHKNQPQKHQYNFDDIATNNKELLSERYETTYEDKETKIFNALGKAHNLTELVRLIGPSDANKYRSLFKDLKLEEGQNYDVLMKRYDQLRTFTDKLLMTLKMSLKIEERRLINLDQFEETFLEYFDYKK